MNTMRAIRAAAFAWVGLLAISGALSGCAGSNARLPECRGTAVPINAHVAAAATDSPAASGARRVHAGTVTAGADHEP